LKQLKKQIEAQPKISHIRVFQFVGPGSFPPPLPRLSFSSVILRALARARLPSLFRRRRLPPTARGASLQGRAK